MTSAEPTLATLAGRKTGRTRERAPASPSREPDRRASKTFAVDFQRSRQADVSKAELRAMAAEAFANTAKMKPVKKDGE